MAGLARSRARTSEDRTRYRPELQGLRALAVSLVVVYHVWLNRVSGGVDVFFLVSGFLLTGQLARAAGRGPITLRALWRRMAARLLPAALVVLLATVVAAAVILPMGRWFQTIRELAASALFVQNWQLAADAVDYAAGNNTASVVQHFWSLSIQGQVFLAWPVLVVLVVLGARRVSADPRDCLPPALLAVTVLSLLYSVALTAANQPLAYFHTLTRLWEFALGGLLALRRDRVGLNPATRCAAGWAGVIGLVSCGLVMPVASVFPGYAALWPTACAALILTAGASGHPLGADRLLSVRPVRYLGDLSYALYLWHWPLLVLVLVATGQESVGLRDGAMIIGVSLLLAALTHHLVELPALRQAGVGSGRALVAASGILVLALAVWQVIGIARASIADQPGDASHPGALALAGAEVDASIEPLPPMVAVSDDWVRLDDWSCAPLARFPSDVCEQPVAEEPQRRIVVVGDSHANQLIGALAPVAQRRGWQVITLIRGACPFSTVSEIEPDDTDCLAWIEAAAAEIADRQPDAVLTLATRDARSGLTEVTPRGFVERWWRLHELGVPVLAVRDNPRFDFSVPDCLAQRGRYAPECGVERSAVYAAEPPWLRWDIPPNVAFLDLTDQLCDAVHCPAEVGNIVVYMDDNHLTATYAATMEPALERYLDDVFGW